LSHLASVAGQDEDASRRFPEVRNEERLSVEALTRAPADDLPPLGDLIADWPCWRHPAAWRGKALRTCARTTATDPGAFWPSSRSCLERRPGYARLVGRR
jgi:hypothetical protein